MCIRDSLFPVQRLFHLLQLCKAFLHGGIGGRTGFVPVSYTHLDVYKRQEQDFIVDDTTLFRVVLYLLVVFTEQLFAALVSSGGNRRLPLAALNNRCLLYTSFCPEPQSVPRPL